MVITNLAKDVLTLSQVITSMLIIIIISMAMVWCVQIAI
jgi:hypothetical protein